MFRRAQSVKQTQVRKLPSFTSKQSKRDIGPYDKPRSATNLDRRNVTSELTVAENVRHCSVIPRDVSRHSIQRHQAGCTRLSKEPHCMSTIAMITPNPLSSRGSSSSPKFVRVDVLLIMNTSVRVVLATILASRPCFVPNTVKHFSINSRTIRIVTQVTEK